MARKKDKQAQKVKQGKKNTSTKPAEAAADAETPVAGGAKPKKDKKKKG